VTGLYPWDFSVLLVGNQLVALSEITGDVNLACVEVRKRKHNSITSNSHVLTTDEVMEELKKKQEQKELKNDEKLKREQEKQEKRKKKMLENQKLRMKIEELRETTGFTWSSLSVKQLKAVLFVQGIKIPSTAKKVHLILLVTQNEVSLEVPLSSQPLLLLPSLVIPLSSESENEEDSDA
jgi:hypothetical protein